MRILIINQPYWPDVVATAQHMADWAEHLASRGHTVTVIASRSVYGQQGAVLPKRQVRGGVQIYRVGSNLFRKGRVLTRLVDFGLFHMRALLKALTLPRQHVVICLTTPPFIGVVGMLTKWLRGSHYVQYEMDLYPDVAVALGALKADRLPARLFDGLHRRLLRSADRVVVLGRCMERVLLAKGLPGLDRTLVRVTPWAVSAAPAGGPNAFLQRHNLGGKCVILYAGNLGLGHDIRTLLGAIEKLTTDDSVRFVFVGGGRRMAEIRQVVEERRYGHVLLLDYLPREELADMLAAGTIHLITQAQGTCGLIVPSKLYGILAAGRPSIYVGPPETEIALTLAEHQAGSVLAPGDVDGLLAAVEKWRHVAPQVLAAQTRAALAGHTRAECLAELTRMVENLGGMAKGK